MSATHTGRKEALLVLRAQLGDRRAIDDLMRRTTPWLRAYLTRLINDDHVAADVTQDALVLAWRHLKHVHEPRAWRAWVYRVATREAFRRLKKRAGRAERIDQVEPEIVAALEATPPDAEELARLVQEIDRLSPNTRAVVVLHYCEGLSIRQVGAVLGLPAGTIKSRLAAGLARLRERLTADTPREPR